MKRQELIDRLTDEFAEFTVLNPEAEEKFRAELEKVESAEEDRQENRRKGKGSSVSPGNRPVSQNGKRSKRQKSAEQSARDEKPKRPYDAGHDERLGTFLSFMSQGARERRYRIYHMALAIVSGLCRYSLNPAAPEDLEKLFEIAGVSADEMNVYVNSALHEDIINLGSPSLKPAAVLLHLLLWNAMCEGSGILGWTLETSQEAAQQKKKNGAGQDSSAKTVRKKARIIRQYVDKGETAARDRLAKAVRYMQERDILLLDCLWTGWSGESTEPDEEQKAARKAERVAKAIQAYDDFFCRYAALYCMNRIAYEEAKGASTRTDQETTRILEKVRGEAKRAKLQRSRELRQNASNLKRSAGMPGAGALFNAPLRQPSADQVINAGADFGNNKNFRAGWNEDSGQTDVLMSFLQGENGIPRTTGKLAEGLALMKQVVQNRLITPQLAASLQRMEQFGRAFDEYKDSLRESIRVLAAENSARKKAYLEEDDGAEIAEQALVAILNGDETYRLDIASYVFCDLEQILGLSIEMPEYPELSDEEEWDDDIWPGDNGKLALTILKDPEVAVYDPNEETDTRLVSSYPLRLNAVIAGYAGCKFDDGISVRKSIMAAFRKMGYSERRARDFAIIVAALKFAKEEGISDELPGGLLYSPLLGEKNRTQRAEDKEMEAALMEDRLTAERDSAIRREKAAERESQRLRHDMAGLLKKQEELENRIAELNEQIKKRDDLLDVYEQAARNADEEGGDESAEENGAESLFPYKTDLNVVLYGGFRSFQQDVEKLIPGIRIVECTSHVDMAVFRNADIIFLQINKTGHSNYWNIIDTAKAAGVPFYHLNYAGPKRCAALMVKQIEEIRGNK